MMLKEAKPKRVHTSWLHFYKILENTNSSIGTKSRLLVVWEWGRRRRRRRAEKKGLQRSHEEIFGGSMLITAVISWVCNDVETYQILHFKYLKFIVCRLQIKHLLFTRRLKRGWLRTPAPGALLSLPPPCSSPWTALPSSFFLSPALWGFLKLWWSIHHIKFTILFIFKCTFQWHQAHPHCRANITAIHLQNFFNFPNWNSAPNKHWLPIPPPRKPSYFDSINWLL